MSDHVNNPTVAAADSPSSRDAETQRLLDAIAREERKLRRRKTDTVAYWVLAALLLGIGWSSYAWPVSREVRGAVYLSAGIMFYVLVVLAVASTIKIVSQSRTLGQQKILAALQEMNGKLSQLIEAQGKH